MGAVNLNHIFRSQGDVSAGKILQCKCENLSLDPQPPHKKLGTGGRDGLSYLLFKTEDPSVDLSEAL